MQAFDVFTSVLGSTARGWRGTNAGHNSRQPEKLLKLYDFEACPFCRLVRETLTELDLDTIIYPCPKGGTRWRSEAENVGGKQQFPLLVDDNSGKSLYEAADIIAYLRATYGRNDHGNGAGPGTIAQIASSATTALRGFSGLRAAGSARTPRELLELYSFESSPYSRLARETLCELELPYILRNMGKARGADMGPPWVRTLFFADTPVQGRNRKRMMAETGRLQVPYLIDPNTNTQMYESADIDSYLRATYQS